MRSCSGVRPWTRRLAVLSAQVVTRDPALRRLPNSTLFALTPVRMFPTVWLWAFSRSAWRPVSAIFES